MKKKIIVIVGTRPEVIKLIPIYIELQRRGQFQVQLISTGQHKEMMTPLFQFFNVKPDKDLALMKSNQTLAALSAQMFDHLERLMLDEKPELVIVQGDTTTAMVAALTAFYNKIKIAHVEAGLRSFDRQAPFPEEINRRVISQVADFHFAPTEKAEQNLRSESALKVYNVGNSVIDSLMIGRGIVENNLTSYQQKFTGILNPERPLILITVHRREIFGDRLVVMCDALSNIAATHLDCIFLFPVHLNPNIRDTVNDKLRNLPNVKLLEPVGYDEMIFLMMQSRVILTDSGGIQEEAPSFNVPVIVLRDITERPEGIAAGCAVLGGTDKEGIVKAFKSVFDDEDKWRAMSQSFNPYGDGKTSARVASILEQELLI